MELDVTETPFDDDNVTGAVRVGDTVRRRTGPWTPAVHSLLLHLERSGFPGSPRVLGTDERGREVLTYLEGGTSPDPRVSFATDDALSEVARLLRCYHDATVGFTPPEGALWRFAVGAPREGEVICHNDVAPYNTIVRNGKPVAFVDWDFAAPGPVCGTSRTRSGGSCRCTGERSSARPPSVGAACASSVTPTDLRT